MVDNYYHVKKSLLIILSLVECFSQNCKIKAILPEDSFKTNHRIRSNQQEMWYLLKERLSGEIFSLVVPDALHRYQDVLKCLRF